MLWGISVRSLQTAPPAVQTAVFYCFNLKITQSLSSFSRRTGKLDQLPGPEPAASMTHASFQMFSRCLWFSLHVDSLILPERTGWAEVHSGTHLAAVVVKHGGDVLFGERSGGVGDEQAGLPHGAVANDDTLHGLHDGGVRNLRTQQGGAQRVHTSPSAASLSCSPLLFVTSFFICRAEIKRPPAALRLFSTSHLVSPSFYLQERLTCGVR